MEFIPLIKKNLKILEKMGASFGGNIPELNKYSENDKIFIYLKYHNFYIKGKFPMDAFCTNTVDFIRGIKIYDFVVNYLNKSHDEIVFSYSSDFVWHMRNSDPNCKHCSCYWYYDSDNTGKIRIQFIDLFDIPETVTGRYERLQFLFDASKNRTLTDSYFEYFKNFLDVYDINTGVFAAKCLSSNKNLYQLNYHTSPRQYTSFEDPMLYLKDVVYTSNLSVFKLTYKSEPIVVCLACSNSRGDIYAISSCSLSELDGTNISIFDERMPKLLDKLSLLGGL